MKIDKLEYYSTSNDRYIWERHPNKDDIVKKINEIIDALNKMDEVEKMDIKKICILSNGTLKEEYNIPTVNERIQEGRKLVFCKDCKYWKMNITVIPTSETDKAMYCTRYMWMTHTDANDFCSRGEKKDDNENRD